jgi:hypothetical protein
MNEYQVTKGKALLFSSIVQKKRIENPFEIESLLWFSVSSGNPDFPLELTTENGN